MVSNSIFIKKADQYIRIQIEDIIWIRSDVEQCEIRTKDKIFSVPQAHDVLIEKLACRQFVKINPQLSINVEYLTSIDILKNEVSLYGETILLDHMYKNTLMQKLNYL